MTKVRIRTVVVMDKGNDGSVVRELTCIGVRVQMIDISFILG